MASRPAREVEHVREMSGSSEAPVGATLLILGKDAVVLNDWSKPTARKERPTVVYVPRYRAATRDTTRASVASNPEHPTAYPPKVGSHVGRPAGPPYTTTRAALQRT